MNNTNKDPTTKTDTAITRLAISITSLILAIMIISYIVVKTVGLTTMYIIGLGIAICLALLSGHILENSEHLTKTIKDRYHQLIALYHKGQEEVRVQMAK